jgi:SAM-dependent methyltransferase
MKTIKLDGKDNVRVEIELNHNGPDKIIKYENPNTHEFYTNFYKNGDNDKALIQTRAIQIQKVLDLVEKHYPSKKRVLEVGSGNGSFLQAMRTRFPEMLVEGIDPYSSSDTVIKKSLFEFNANNKYDLIIFLDVFEHFENPQEVLKRLKELLQENGVILLKVPNKKSLLYFCSILLLIFVPGIGRKLLSRLYQIDFPPPHFFFYDRKSLSTLLKEEGFLINTSSFMPEVFLGSIFQRVWGVSPLLKPIFVSLLFFYSLICFGPLQDSLLVTAQVRK